MKDNIFLLAPVEAVSSGAKDESLAILNMGIEVTPMIGNVTYHEVLNAISSRPHTIFWYAGHLGPDGISIGGETVPPTLLTSMLRGRFKLIVLNSCSSYDLARVLFLENRNTSIVFTVNDVWSLEAFQLGVLFLKAYLQTNDAHTAYQQVRTPTYYLLSDTPKVSRGMDDLTKALYDLRAELHNAKTEIAVLSHQVKALEENIRRVGDMPHSQVPENLLKVGIGLLTLISVLLIVLVIVLSGGI